MSTLPHISANANAQITFMLRPKPPFELKLTVWALRRRPQNIIDRWDGEWYRRVFVFGGMPVEISVRQTGSAENPRLHAVLAGERLYPDMKQIARTLLHSIFGLGVDMVPFYRVANRHPQLRVVAEKFRGLKPPRFPTVFEALVNAFACQQLSLTVGIELLNRLAVSCGMALHTGGVLHYGFPRPQELACASALELRDLGFSGNKVRAFLQLGQDLVAGRLRLDQLEAMTNEAAVDSLLNILGVGRWTAEYVLLRGLRRLDVFPGDDVGARNRLAQWLHRERPLDYVGVQRAVRQWQPYAGLVYFHLLLDGLEATGQLHV